MAFDIVDVSDLNTLIFEFLPSFLIGSQFLVELDSPGPVS